MFETTVVESRRSKTSAQKYLTLPVSLTVHGVAIAIAVVMAAWEVEFPFNAPAQISQYSLASPPPPPPPPPPAAKKLVTARVEPVKVPQNILELAPTSIPEKTPELEVEVGGVDEGVEGGVEGGVAGGVVSGVVGGEVGGVKGGVVGSVRQPGEPVVIPLDAKLPLVPLSQVYPQYPKQARLNQLEGTVIVRYVIDKTGRVREVTILKKAYSSPLFDESAVRAIRNWRFRPYFENGVPVEVVHELTIHFVLQA